MAHYSVILLEVYDYTAGAQTYSFEADISGVSSTPAVRLNRTISFAGDVVGISSSLDIRVALGYRRRFTANIIGESQTTSVRFQTLRKLEALISGLSETDSAFLSMIFLGLLNRTITQVVTERSLTEETEKLVAAASTALRIAETDTAELLADYIEHVYLADKATSSRSLSRTGVRTIE